MSGTALVVFDVYGTLLDVDGAAREAASGPDASGLADVWPALSRDWRRKQLEYTWLRTLMGAHADFEAVTEDALDWAMEAHGLADAPLRARLLELYRTLPPYPEVEAALAALDARGLRLAVLSNGTPGMLEAALGGAGLAGRIDPVLSIEAVGRYKPVAAVYALVEQATGMPPADVLFVSANGWDAAGAAHFGFRTVWINRAGAPVDRLPARPEAILPDLARLPEFA